VREEGLTLIEILVTMAIVMLLASIAMPLSKVSSKRVQEVELRQHLRTIRSAIDLFKLEWNRDGDVLIGAVCLKNKLTCKEVTGPYGYPKSLDTLLSVKLTGQDATVRNTVIRRYLRSIPIDPLTGKSDWLLRCYKDQPKPSSWCGEDVYDIMTRSEAAALDGTKYQDW
jgi:general secretion pathway protein G